MTSQKYIYQNYNFYRVLAIAQHVFWVVWLWLHPKVIAAIGLETIFANINDLVCGLE